MDPKDVKPRNFNHNGNIIYTSGDGKFSIAKGVWTDDNTKRFAMRWNGDVSNSKDKGYPSVFDFPMWFQLPENDIKGVLAALIENCDDVQI